MIQAITFTGQGSQHLGMGAHLTKQFPAVKNYIEIANETLKINLWDIIQNDPDKLSQTTYAQPAIFLISFIIWSILKKEHENFQCAIMSGHSLGEYTALCASQSLEFKDAIKLVYHRGQLMQNSSNNGAMAAILKADENFIKTLCAKINQHPSQIADIACLNAPNQTVIAGNKLGIEKIIEQLQNEKDVRIIQLPISVPSHSRLMKKAAEQFPKFLNQVKFSTPKIPVINNADVTIETEAEQIKKTLIKQLCFPVRWIETIEKMNTYQVNTIIEIGPKPTLFNLNKKIAKTTNHLAICNEKNLINFLSTQ